PVGSFESARASVAGGLYPPFFAAMLERGVAMAPGPYEAMFPGLAHSDDDIEAVIGAAGEAAALVAAAGS
ncbi:MAG TPA: aspartate aminotransferase family protein, partial [Acidimicrobiales bacterium]|nr:aspartate aminotransferase family protein [Acidimicrobiales bacterium]